MNPITLARKSQGMTQHALAAKAGVNQSLISFIEHGYLPPKSKNREAIARALGVPESSLFKTKESGP